MYSNLFDPGIERHLIWCRQASSACYLLALVFVKLNIVSATKRNLAPFIELKTTPAGQVLSSVHYPIQNLLTYYPTEDFHTEHTDELYRTIQFLVTNTVANFPWISTMIAVLGKFTTGGTK